MKDKQNKEQSKTETKNQFCYLIKETIFDALVFINNMYESKQNKESIKSGFGFLEFQRGELIVLSARAGIETSDFIFNLLKKMSIENKNKVGLIVPGNYQEANIGLRIISMISHVSTEKIKRGLITIDDFKRIQKASEIICKSPIYRMNIPNCCLLDIELSVKKMVKEQNVKFIMIMGFEYIEEIVDDFEKDIYRFTLDYVLVELKKLAEKYNIPILIQIQLPPVEDHHIPVLTDFTKYLIIPTKANKVLFLDRDSIYDGYKFQDTLLIVAKNESGIIDDIPLSYQLATGIIKNKKI